MNTPKLKRLEEAMTAFRAGGFARAVLYQPLSAAGGDEIDRLGSNYNAMVKRIEEQALELERRDVARGELIANVSNGLRTPLATVRGYLETLLLREESFSPGERRRFLDIAARQTEHLGVLVADLFELARLDARGYLLDAEPVQLSELAHDVGHDFELAARRQETALWVDADRRVPFALADMGLIERALRSLIENALRRSRGGSVKLAVESRGSLVTVQVADTGAAFRPEELPFLFDRFGPTNARWKIRSGSGDLGLAIVKRIVELHGAQVKVMSAPGNGAVFSFSLPVAGR